MLRDYESYRVCGLGTPQYALRRSYVEHLITKKGQYLDLFTNINDIDDVTRKQQEAEVLAQTAEPGWQEAMTDAGIWDDDKEVF